MADGQMLIQGTPVQLKETYGVGYQLIIQSEEEKLDEDEISKICSGAKLIIEDDGKQIVTVSLHLRKIMLLS